MMEKLLFLNKTLKQFVKIVWFNRVQNVLKWKKKKEKLKEHRPRKNKQRSLLVYNDSVFPVQRVCHRVPLSPFYPQMSELTKDNDTTRNGHYI